MGKFSKLFQKAGGVSVLKQYAKSRVLCYALAQTAMNGLSKKSLELVRLGVTNKIICRLRKKYRKFIANFTANYIQAPQTHSNKVWVCWLQGMEQAPALVQRCYQSLQEHLTDREIILLTEENYREYVQFPAHITEKAAAGIIPPAQFSDLIRLELLNRYGGTWIDATVFCSGSNIPGYMLDADLFMFQILKPGADGQVSCVSNWFITACTNHPILLLTQALLYEYWKKHNSLIDYFIFHDLFQIATEAFPEAWNAVIPFSSATPHILLLRMFEPYEPDCWSAIKAMTPFHKLSYKFSPDDAAISGTYYQELIAQE